MIDIRKPANILFLASFVIIVFAFGFNVGKFSSMQITSGANRNNNASIDFSLFWDVWKTLEDKYVDKSKLDPKRMYYGAIKGMVASLEDPYTMFLLPSDNKISKDDLEGKFEGIGAQLGLKNGSIVIIAPLKNSPAEKAGAKAGDYILKVDDISTKNWSLQKAVSKIRGPRGTFVKLTLKRDEKIFNIKIKRDQIIVPSVEIQKIKNVAYLKLNRFGEDTNKEWQKAVNTISLWHKERIIKGMILDLRDNPGGYLQGAIYIASEFLPKNTLVVSQEYSKNNIEKYFVERKGNLLTIPLVVLVNGGSASASEIVAGALRDNNRAELVGEKTFGKGSIQQAIDLSDGSGLHVTVARWILPKGTRINGKGIIPNYIVVNNKDSKNTLEQKDDKQLEKAILILLK